MYGYPNSIAVVTGAANGIGRAIARRLASEGCKLALWDNDGAALDRVSSELIAQGAQVSSQVLDVSVLQAVRSATDKAVSELGGSPRILVNCAGIGRVASILDGSPEEFDETIRVNVRGTYNCCYSLVPLMTAQRAGTIINIASWFGKSGRPMSLAYCASKFAIIGMTQSMALDLAKHAIRVNAVCPGTIANTLMRERADEEAAAKGLPPSAERVHLIPMGRLGYPEDVANVVAFLVSDEASYMTGQSLNVTGGLWMN